MIKDYKIYKECNEISQESLNNSDMSLQNLTGEFIGLASLIRLIIFSFLFLPELINIYLEAQQ